MFSYAFPVLCWGLDAQTKKSNSVLSIRICPSALIIPHVGKINLVNVRFAILRQTTYFYILSFSTIDQNMFTADSGAFTWDPSAFS